MAEEPNAPQLPWLEAALAESPRQAFKESLRADLQRRVYAMTPAQATGLRQGFSTITPYITVPDIERLISFTKEAFGAVETERSTGSAGGTHCEVRIGNSMLMLGGGPPAAGREKLTALHLYVPNVDEVYRRAVEAGAESLGEPRDQFYGDREAAVKDPSGNQWYIATRQGPSHIHEGLRSVTPFLHPQNALGLIEFLKGAFGAKEEAIYKSDDGRLQHALVRIGDAVLEMGEAHGQWQPMPSAFYLYVPDADAVFERAVRAGAKPLYVPADQHYGDRLGGVEDAWGNTWHIASHLKA